ncbi:MAG: isoprenylcysteine carboxylmethyltransferase family protein [Anaerolineales bacterium]|nr:isoprenylcysteine carboxylmethyltransferase family protein [Anaerolineales bacterium]
MELFPRLGIGWLNGWILMAFHLAFQGILLLVFPRDVVTRLFDRSGWSKKQVVLTILGKLFSLACIVLIVLTPLKLGSSVFFIGIVLVVIGLATLVAAMLNFKNAPLGEPATGGVYRFSRHPQIVALALLFAGYSLATGSWIALITLVISRIFQHEGIVGEEQVCLKMFGQSYQTYMERTPRYIIF